MKLAIYLAPALLVSVIFLIRAEFRKERQQIYFIKPIATIIVIGVALMSFLEPAWNTTYTVGVLLGLLFSLGGDIALMFQENKKAFTIGLGLFLVAHIIYAVVFGMMGRMSVLDIYSTIALLVLGMGLYRLFQSKLGSMKIPVIAYIVIISVMVSRAIAIFANPDVDNAHALMIVVGAVLFYISDVILAANRFWQPWQYNRISLAFYYAGQLLIALAASYLG
ncbi:MAG: lysoplasmalogenase [Chloroflexi bacterium]|nr:lysoplasmalogenase [Chloroflexota bacterium]